MPRLLERFSPNIIRVFFTTVTILVLAASALNFMDVMVFKATSNDQCGWLNRSDGEPGAIITDVAPGGVTDKAGVRNGDLLIKINGQKVTTPTQAMSIINPMKAGEFATYLIERDGTQFETKVEILKLVNIQYLGYTLLGLAFLVVGYIVVMTRPQGKTQRMFAYYSLMTLLAGAFSTLAINPITDPSWRVYSLGAAFTVGRVLGMPVFLMFFLDFPVRRNIMDRTWFKLTLFVFSAAMTAPFFLGILPALPVQAIPFLINAPIVFYFAGLILFALSYFRRLDPSKRKKFKPILDAVAIGLLTVVYLLIVQTSNPFAIFTNPILLMPGFLLVGVPVAFGYSIFRYRLMDIDLIVKRSLLYGIITASLAAIYLGFVFGIGSLLSTLVGKSENEVLNVVAFLVIAFAFDPIKQRAQGWIDRIFYRERHDYQKALLEFSQELPRLMNMDQILNSMVNRISSTMHVEKVAVILCDEVEGCYSVAKNMETSCCVFGDEQGGLLNLLRESKVPNYFGLISEEPESVKVNDRDREKIIRSGTVLSVPMFMKDRLIGTIHVGEKLSDKAYSQEDIDLLSTVGSQAAIAIENARLHKSEIERQKIQEELALARRIQQGLLPKQNPDIDGLDIAGVAIPAQVVGGDYFDFIEIGSKKLLVVIADVAGKGMSAALYMSKIQGMVQLAAHMYSSPKEMLTHVNRRIYDGIERKSFITMVLALFDMEQGEVKICRAGHNKVLIGTDGTLEYLSAEGIGLGLERGPVFENTLQEVRKPLKPGGLFFFYTDGLTEAMNEQEVQLGEDSVLQILKSKRHLTSEEIQRSITTAVEEFVGKAEQHDDLTLVVVKIRDSGSPS